MEEKRSSLVPVAIAMLLALPVLYFGSYLALSVPQPGNQRSVLSDRGKGYLEFL